jgi:DNA mismatch repair protein MutL
MSKLALTRPDVSFRLINEAGKSLLYTPGNNDLLSTIYAVFDRKTAEGMVPFDNQIPPVIISGYISTPENARGNRSRQIFIVNGRNINARIISVAVDEAIRGWFVKGRFPALVMQINIPPELVDINVHPQKKRTEILARK